MTDDVPTWLTLTPRALHDLELLATGAFAPVTRFMGRDDYESVTARMRLADGVLFPVPITLPAGPAFAGAEGRTLELRDANHDLIAHLDVEEVFEADPMAEARAVLGTTDPRHPMVAEMRGWPPLRLSGPMRLVRLPRHHDFASLRRTPAEVRQALASLGGGPVVAFQTRNPIHRSHEELTKRAMDRTGGVLLLHPVVGMTKPGDVDHYTRVRAYKTLVERYYDPSRVLLSLLPLAMRMAGPREALWHAIIRRNYGATHFIVGRDHAGPGLDSAGKPFYAPLAAQQLCQTHAREIGIEILAFDEMVYLPGEDRYEETSRVPPDTRTAALSGTAVRDMLARGETLPAWYTRPEVAALLAEQGAHRGVCVWLTGLSGSGKTATADALTARLLERGRRVTVLDGDVVRTHLSKGLGFTREDRDTNIRRIGFVAAEIVRHGGAVICAAVSPYAATREECRQMVGPSQFIEVFVDTPIDVCESRDTKGLYAKARRGELRGFTGIDDPYEAPAAADVVLDTVNATVDDNAARLIETIETRGLLR